MKWRVVNGVPVDFSIIEVVVYFLGVCGWDVVRGAPDSSARRCLEVGELTIIC